MIELTQQPDLAIGSKTAIEEFSKKECAKLLVLSDSHGNPQILQSIITSFGPMCDAMCFCGDGIFDLVYALELAFNDNDFGKKIPPVLYFVRGNGDNSTSTIFTDQRISITVPDFQEFSVAGRKIFLTHGHRYGVYYGLSELRTEAVERGCDIVLYGHTHVPNSLKTHAVRNGKKEFLAVLNPGSCSQARGGMPNTFATVTVAYDEEKISCQYYKILWDRYGDTVFSKIPTPRGEIRVF